MVERAPKPFSRAEEKNARIKPDKVTGKERGSNTLTHIQGSDTSREGSNVERDTSVVEGNRDGGMMGEG